MSAAIHVAAEIVVVRNNNGVLPVRFSPGSPIGMLTIGENSDCPFADYCNRYYSMPTAGVPALAQLDKAIATVRHCRTLIVGVFTSEKWAVDAVCKLGKDHDLIVSFFIPDSGASRFSKIGGMKGIIVGGSNDEAAQIRCSEAIFGGDDFYGRLEKSIPGIGKRGEGYDIAKVRLGYTLYNEDLDAVEKMSGMIDSIVRESIKAKAFPGCQIAVVMDGTVMFDEAFGTLDYQRGAKKTDRSTLFDVASMTKATATLAGLMSAYDDGLYSTDGIVSDYLPRLRGTDKESLKVKELLFHTSGMPAIVDTYNLMADTASFSGKLIQYKNSGPYTIKIEKGVYGHNKAYLRRDLFGRKRTPEFDTEIAPGLFGGDSMKIVMSDAIYDRSPGEKKYVYSCLNFCMLKDMEEALTGVPHDRWVSRRVFGPIGANRSMYRPSDHGTYMNNIAPTERDDFLRKSLIKGFVHDEMAAYLGGVSGNAGLFSTAGDIAKLCQTWLNGGQYGGTQVFKESTVRKFTTETLKSANRGLGFDKPSRFRSLRNIGMSASSFGHTGFTGTCFWVDPEKNIAVVILTNRINPSRDNPAFSRLDPRSAIVKAVYDCLVEIVEDDDAISEE